MRSTLIPKQQSRLLQCLSLLVLMLANLFGLTQSLQAQDDQATALKKSLVFQKPPKSVLPTSLNAKLEGGVLSQDPTERKGHLISINAPLAALQQQTRKGGASATAYVAST